MRKALTAVDPMNEKMKISGGGVTGRKSNKESLLGMVCQIKSNHGLLVAVFNISSFFVYNDFIFASKSSSYFEAR